MQPSPADLYHLMLRIRRFEETVLENYARGVFFGTTHTYLGQEANAAGVLTHIEQRDVIFSNHRCHGHFLAYDGDMRSLFAELMGRATGVCGGRGGSQHLHWQNFYSNGVQGGIVPIATGMAYAERALQTGAISLVFLGDGTLGEGVVYESLNIAALWKLPVLYIVENNQIAQTTPIELSIAGSIDLRFKAFGIPVLELDTSDVLEIYTVAERLIYAVRTQCQPQALVLHTRRFGPHSKGDDTRPNTQIEQLRLERDPLTIHAPRLPQAEREEIERRVNEEVAAAFRQALDDPYPTLDNAPPGI